MATHLGMVDPAIFEHLQEKIDEDTSFRDVIRDIVQQLEKQTRSTQAILSRAHSTPTSQTSDVVTTVETSLHNEISTISKLSGQASKQPYYKWNTMWSHKVQDVCFTILFCGWLGGFSQYSQAGENGIGKLLTIEDVGNILNIPVNLKDRDAFHLTIEEYLLALVALLEELARLARNSVTLQDFRRPVQIAQFIKDVHAGFQILNLKNDILRKRVDGIKYRVKEVEDVVYDLSLRNLLSKDNE